MNYKSSIMSYLTEHLMVKQECIHYVCTVCICVGNDLSRGLASVPKAEQHRENPLRSANGQSGSFPTWQYDVAPYLEFTTITSETPHFSFEEHSASSSCVFCCKMTPFTTAHLCYVPESETLLLGMQIVFLIDH